MVDCEEKGEKFEDDFEAISRWIRVLQFSQAEEICDRSEVCVVAQRKRKCVAALLLETEERVHVRCPVNSRSRSCVVLDQRREAL